MNKEDILDIQAGPKLDLLIAAIMEPKPGDISLRDLREKERMRAWYSTHSAYSPGRWWKAEIGTDANFLENGRLVPGGDLRNVEWVAGKEPSQYIDDAWEVAEKLHLFTFCNLDENTDVPPDCNWTMRIYGDDSATEYVSAETVPLLICRVALIVSDPGVTE